MDVFLPYSRLIDKMVYGNRHTRKLFSKITHAMGWHDDGNKHYTGIHKHATAEEIRNRIGTKRFNTYYKFSFVRNPYDFLVSLYFYIKQAKNHRSHHKVVDMDFGDFLKWHIGESPQRQVDFLMGSQYKTFIVNYVGRFETIQKDIDTILNNLNLPINRSLPHKNPSVFRKKKNFQEYYNKESRILVSEYFGKDLQLLGYSAEGFDNNHRILS